MIIFDWFIGYPGHVYTPKHIICGPIIIKGGAEPQWKGYNTAFLFDLFCLIAPFPHMRPLCYVFPPESNHCTIERIYEQGNKNKNR